MNGNNKKEPPVNCSTKNPFSKSENSTRDILQEENEMPEVDDKLIGDDLEIKQAQPQDKRPTTDKNNY